MRSSDILSVIFIGLLLFEVSAGHGERRPRKPPRKTPSTPRFSHNNAIGPTYTLKLNNSLPQPKKISKERFIKEHIKSWLNPLDNILFSEDTPVYSVRSNGVDSHPDIEEYPNIFRHITTNLYDDFISASAEEVNRNSTRASGYNSQQSTLNQFMYSRRYRRKPPKSLINPQTQRRTRSIANNKVLGNYKVEKNRQIRIPGMIYPEVLVIVDYSLYKKFHRSVWELVTYLIGLWNGIDMRFQSLKRPTVRLSIAGILIAEDKKALSYISNNFYGKETLFTTGAFAEKKTWLFKQKALLPHTTYDIAITMTALKLRGTDYEPQQSGGEMKGLATNSGACLIDEQFGMVHKTGIFNDEGAYEAIMAAAHEIGHLMGINHDDARMSNTCYTGDGYIMSPILYHKARSWSWSKCSKTDFNNFLRAGNGTCMYNKPQKTAIMPRILPGKLMNAHEQCRAIGYFRAIVTHRMCLKLICRDKKNSSYYYYTDHSPADGTHCANGKICIRGRCRAEASVRY